MRRIVLLIVLLPTAGWSDGECKAIEAAYARADLDALIAIAPTSVNMRSLRLFRLAALHIQHNARGEAKRAIASGLAITKDRLAVDEADVEQLLFGAMFDGLHVLTHRWSFATHGFRGYRRLGRAEQLDPGNLRAALVRGSAWVVVPRWLGGDPTRAASVLTDAIHAAPEHCDASAWGQIDVLMWLGRAAEALDESARADAYYRQALARSPGNVWVQRAIDGLGYSWRQ